MAAPKIPQLKVVGIPAINNYGTPFSVYEKGIAGYERLRINGDVELVLDDGTKTKGIVQQLQVGALIDLINGFGNQAVYTAGRIYSPLSLVQALTEAASEDVLDVTKLYTAVVVMVPMEKTPTGQVMPA